MYADHLPGLESHLNIPERTFLPVKAIPGPFLLNELPGLGVFDSCSVPESLAFPFPAFGLACCPCLWEGAGAPRSHPETVQALGTRARSRFTRLELGEIGADGAAEKRRHQDAAYPVPEARSAGFGTGSPWRILRDHAVLRAGDQTRLLQARLGLKVLTDGILCWRPVRLQHAAHLARLDALFASTACELPWGPEGPRRHRHALVPGAQPPAVQVLVPVAHSETVPLVGGALTLVTVGVERRPAVHVGAPHRSALAATRTAVTAHTSPPRP